METRSNCTPYCSTRHHSQDCPNHPNQRGHSLTQPFPDEYWKNVQRMSDYEALVERLYAKLTSGSDALTIVYECEALINSHKDKYEASQP